MVGTNWGAILSGMGGGVAPYLNQAADRARQQQAQQMQVQALMAGLQAQGGQQQPMPSPQPPMQGTPPQQPPMQGGGMPSPLAKPGGDAAVLAALGSKQQPSAPPQPQQPQPPAQGMGGGGSFAPNSMMQDQNKAMIAILSAPNIDPGAKLDALKSLGAMETPLEKMTIQLENAQQRLAAQQQMLDERMQTSIQLRQMADSTSMANANSRVAATERGQDIGASNAQARIGAQERGQDMRATTAQGAQDIQKQRANTYQQGTQDRAIQGEEGLKIKQQNADTSTDRAGTYKYGTVQRAQMAGRKQDETEKLDAAKIKKMETSVSKENKKPFDAAKTQYNRAASLYQSLTAPGRTPSASPDDIAFAKQKMDGASDNMVRLAGSSGAAAALTKPTAGEEVRTDGQGNYFVLRDGKPTPAEPPAGQ